jgi:hypothetical protein
MRSPNEITTLYVGNEKFEVRACEDEDEIGQRFPVVEISFTAEHIDGGNPLMFFSLLDSDEAEVLAYALSKHAGRVREEGN